MRVPLPGADVFPDDSLLVKTSRAERNKLAVRAFFYEYFIMSTYTNLCPGFLSGLEKMAYRLVLKSNLARASQTVAFAGHGRSLHRPKLAHRTGMLFQELLGS